MPGTSTSVSAFITWHVEVPMTMSIWPGPDGPGGGRGDVRVDVADRDGDALGEPGPRGRLRGQRARAGAERGERRPLELVGDEPGEALVERRQEAADG